MLLPSHRKQPRRPPVYLSPAPTKPETTQQAISQPPNPQTPHKHKSNAPHLPIGQRPKTTSTSGAQARSGSAAGARQPRSARSSRTNSARRTGTKFMTRHGQQMSTSTCAVMRGSVRCRSGKRSCTRISGVVGGGGVEVIMMGMIIVVTRRMEKGWL